MIEGERLATSKPKSLWKNEYFQTAVTVILVLVIVFGFWFGSQFVLRSQYPMLAVASGSMCKVQHMHCDGWSHPFERTLHVGDLIIIQGTPAKDIRTGLDPEGDIIVFHQTGSTDTLIVHRAIEKKTTELPIFDDGGTSFWTLVSGIASDDATEKKMDYNSYRMVLSSQTLDVYHDFDKNQYYPEEGSFRIWIYGANTSNSIRLEFWNEVYTAKADGYYVQIADDFSGWRSFRWNATEFASIGTPRGWDNIRCVRLSGSDNVSGTYRLDGLMGSALNFITKGDGNSGPDPSPVPASNVVGKVIMRVPWAGHLALYMRNSVGIFIILAIIILLIMVEFVVPLFTKRKTATETKEEEKKPEDETQLY
jgi:signal peptidase I